MARLSKKCGPLGIIKEKRSKEIVRTALLCSCGRVDGAGTNGGPYRSALFYFLSLILQRLVLLPVGARPTNDHLISSLIVHPFFLCGEGACSMRLSSRIEGPPQDLIAFSYLFQRKRQKSRVFLVG